MTRYCIHRGPKCTAEGIYINPGGPIASLRFTPESLPEIAEKFGTWLGVNLRGRDPAELLTRLMTEAGPGKQSSKVETPAAHYWVEQDAPPETPAEEDE